MPNWVRNDILIPRRLLHEIEPFAEREFEPYPVGDHYPDGGINDEFTQVTLFTECQPPIAWLKTIAARYPEEYLRLEWFELTNEWTGTFEAQDGKVSLCRAQSDWFQLKDFLANGPGEGLAPSNPLIEETDEAPLEIMKITQCDLDDE